MKTAISVPDGVFERAARHAKRLGMSRSEFFSKAAERWVVELEESELTEAIDAVLADAGADENALFLQRAAARLPETDVE